MDEQKMLVVQAVEAASGSSEALHELSYLLIDELGPSSRCVVA